MGEWKEKRRIKKKMKTYHLNKIISDERRDAEFKRITIRRNQDNELKEIIVKNIIYQLKKRKEMGYTSEDIINEIDYAISNNDAELLGTVIKRTKLSVTLKDNMTIKKQSIQDDYCLINPKRAQLDKRIERIFKDVLRNLKQSCIANKTKKEENKSEHSEQFDIEI